MSSGIIVRDVRAADIPGIQAIYAWYVERTAITYECAAPDEAEFRRRVAEVTARYPWLVAEQDGRVAGFAYAHRFVDREAYDWTAETTIYVSPDARKRGVGAALYTALEKALARMGVLNLYAKVAWPDREDEYLTRNSAQFHAHWGYREVGRLTRCGYKFGRWYSLSLMEKMIGEHVPDQPPVIPYPLLTEHRNEQ